MLRKLLLVAASISFLLDIATMIFWGRSFDAHLIFDVYISDYRIVSLHLWNGEFVVENVSLYNVPASLHHDPWWQLKYSETSGPGAQYTYCTSKSGFNLTQRYINLSLMQRSPLGPMPTCWLNNVSFPIWLSILVFAILPIFCVPMVFFKVEEGLCRHCKYDLRYSVDRCPECGSKIMIAS